MLFQKNQKFSIRRDASFGDQLIATLMVHVLNDNGIESYYESRIKKETAIFWGGCTYIENLIDCPLSKNCHENMIVHWPIPNEDVAKKNTKISILDDLLNQFKIKYKIKKEIKINRNFIPVKYEEIKNINRYDVVICSDVGKFSTHKKWPYFNKLKSLLSDKKISFIDLNENKIKDNECLNYVKSSKIYLGMDTGTSHYVSMVANKGLVIQSGVTSSNWWNLYNYKVIEYKTQCCPCFLKTHENCIHENICTKNISAEFVFEEIEKLI